METKFQTSFIPKKPLTAPIVTSHAGGVSIFMVIAVLIFIVSLAGAGFAYGWKNYLESAQVQYKKDLDKRKDEFNPVLIEQLKRINTKIDTAKVILARHLAVSEIFDIVARLTAQNVRFNSFDFTAPATDKDGLKVTMRGVGASFSAIAWQSDVFGQSSQYGRNKVLVDPTVSDLSVDQNGNVAFSFTATMKPVDISYEKILEATLDSESGGSTETGSGAASSTTQ
jgi:hypothetical protein